jgi:hypothetical protein
MITHYNSETDKVVASYSYGDDDDPVMEHTTLRVTNSGHFYLSGRGGPLSRWRRIIDGMEAISAFEASAWIRRHDPSSAPSFNALINRSTIPKGRA